MTRKLIYHYRCNRCGVTSTKIEGMDAHQEDMDHVKYGFHEVENEEMLMEPCIWMSGEAGVAFYLERCRG